ncbi:helix-turn-helix domain-containing protein [Bifidobacterium oedipodis]|uniref:XRE family transcriptional regulator n=1 Tax=Bifidobacterium oedipodis TaxID=2675322 RepID=A0A7Y0EMN9_9BIFI|nr:helix-turn-helix transcriptional regulator [Bifidobacterium sp. DSM 109957]NMM93089.1 XRE family transcriptional regulator [Bifidobacterium sp. DSM 109957]
MTEIEQLITHYSHSNPTFKQEYAQEKERLAAAVALMELREQEGLSQRDLAEKVHKPQSTIARIESGKMNATIGLLEQIAAALNKKLRISFVDA